MKYRGFVVETLYGEEFGVKMLKAISLQAVRNPGG